MTMPEPQRKKGMYKVQVTDSNDRWNSGCSGAFSLRSSEDTPEHGDPDGAYLEVVSPMDHDGAVAGEEYTVEVRLRTCTVQYNTAAVGPLSDVGATHTKQQHNTR